MRRPLHTLAIVVVNVLAIAYAIAMFALMCGGCDYTADKLTSLAVDGEADHGTVYVCDSGAMCDGGEEWCWDRGEDELEELLGASCHRISIFERAWPAIVGCAYGCPLEGTGCNAHCGCACEAP